MRKLFFIKTGKKTHVCRCAYIQVIKSLCWLEKEKEGTINEKELASLFRVGRNEGQHGANEV